MSIIEEKGWTVTYIPWEDMEGKPRVVGRFKTTKEKDEFLEKIHKPDSGWMDEELAMIGVINDYNYMLPRQEIRIYLENGGIKKWQTLESQRDAE